MIHNLKEFVIKTFQLVFVMHAGDIAQGKDTRVLKQTPMGNEMLKQKKVSNCTQGHVPTVSYPYHQLLLPADSGCGSVGRVVASDTRGSNPVIGNFY